MSARAVPADNPDEELLRLRAGYSSANAEIRRIEALPDAHIGDDLYDLDDQRWHAIQESARLPAQALPGLRAKAAILLDDAGLVGTMHDGHEPLALSIVRDVMAVTEGGAA